MTVTSGLKLKGSWLPSGPVGACLKTLLDTSAWASTKCYLTWQTKATPRGRVLFQLAPSMHHIDETGYGLLPTMTVSSGAQTKENPTPGQTGGTTLWGFARMFPTPCAADNRDRGGPSMPAIQRRMRIGKSIELSMTVDGPLNPLFVEWLMGYPEGWTDLEDSETQSSPKSPK